MTTYILRRLVLMIPVAFLVTVGVFVLVRLSPGDPIATIEAMKMEHVVAAPIGGRVADLAVRAGEQVTRGQRLASLEP